MTRKVRPNCFVGNPGRGFGPYPAAALDVRRQRDRDSARGADAVPRLGDGDVVAASTAYAGESAEAAADDDRVRRRAALPLKRSLRSSAPAASDQRCSTRRVIPSGLLACEAVVEVHSRLVSVHGSNRARKGNRGTKSRKSRKPKP